MGENTHPKISQTRVENCGFEYKIHSLHPYTIYTYKLMHPSCMINERKSLHVLLYSQPLSQFVRPPSMSMKSCGSLHFPIFVPSGTQNNKANDIQTLWHQFTNNQSETSIFLSILKVMFISTVRVSMSLPRQMSTPQRQLRLASCPPQLQKVSHVSSQTKKF